MKFKKISYALMLTFGMALLSTSCTKYATDEQIQKLDETKEAAMAADKTIAEKRKVRDNLKAELDAKVKELKKLEANRDYIKRKTGKE